MVKPLHLFRQIHGNLQAFKLRSKGGALHRLRVMIHGAGRRRFNVIDFITHPRNKAFQTLQAFLTQTVFLALILRLTERGPFVPARI